MTLENHHAINIQKSSISMCHVQQQTVKIPVCSIARFDSRRECHSMKSREGNTIRTHVQASRLLVHGKYAGMQSFKRVHFNTKGLQGEYDQHCLRCVWVWLSPLLLVYWQPRSLSVVNITRIWLVTFHHNPIFLGASSCFFIFYPLVLLTEPWKSSM